MAEPTKIVPVKCNLDLAAEAIDQQTARFMKGLTPYVGATDAYQGIKEGQNKLKNKPNQSNELYVNIPLPAGDNWYMGGRGFPETNEVYVAVWNSQNNHFWYRINCADRTFNIIKIDPCFDWQKKPEFFMGVGQITLKTIPLVNPDTKEEFFAKELKWTDGNGYQGYLRVDDSIATGGFDPTLFPYFAGTYDKCHIVRMGVPTPKHCIKVSEVPAVPNYTSEIVIQFAGGITVSEVANGVTFPGIPGIYNQVTFAGITNLMKFRTNDNGNQFASISSITINGTVSNNGTRPIFAVSISTTLVNDQKPNKLLYGKLFFIQRNIDVWGRPSEWGARSSEYVAGINDCTNNSNNIARCVNAELDAGDPFINAIEVGYLFCKNGTPTVWKKAETIFLYEGSNIGEWWKRKRNPDVVFDSATNKISYTFCASKECEPIPTDETSRLENPLPRRSKAILQLNDNTALFNNKSKFAPFSQDLMKKITAKVISPDASDLGLRNITIFIPIYNPIYGREWTQVSKDGNNGYYFGGFSNLGGYSAVVAQAFAQDFVNKTQSGFTGYLVGGGSVTSTQVYENDQGVFVDDPQHTGSGNIFRKSYQKFVFNNIPKGKYIFRLASHRSDPNADANYRATSTTVWGLCPFEKIGNFLSIYQNSRDQYRSNELLIDVCDKDYNTLEDNKMLVIADLSSAVSSGAGTCKARSFYVNETRVNGYNQNPMELLNVITGESGIRAVSQITDHNGFGWFACTGRGRTFAIDYIHRCRGQQARFDQGSIGMAIDYFYGDEQGIFGLGFRDFFNTPCNRILIKGKVLLSGTNIGVSNALVAYTRGGTTLTDESGNFTIIAHDFVLALFQGQPRHDKILIGNGCGYTGVNNACIVVTDVDIFGCTSCQERVITIAQTILLEYATLKSLLSGGVYGVGCVGWDWLGRATYVQPMGYLNIPTINESKNIAPSQVEISIDPTAIFPPEIEYLTFFVTRETTIEKYLDWIVDKVEFIDAQGLVNNLNPTQIKIYYGSIIEFAKLYQYNVTTQWEFLAIDQNTPVTNDKVQFFLNGDGKFFNKAVTGLVKYADTGLYFTIDYTPDLKDLKENALIRLYREKECTGNEPYYEICGSKVEIVGRQAQTNKFTLNAFDTYYLNRTIPVPAPQTQGATESITTTVTTGNTSVATQRSPLPTPTVLELRTFGFRFEHFAPSNLWGAGCQHVGRLNVKNPYEAELIKLYEVALSGGLSANGQLNYLCYFDDKKTTLFQVPDIGGITSVIGRIGAIFVICKNACFSVGYNDNLGRVNENGTFQAPSTPNEFGKPIEVDDFGCDPRDKLTIQTRNGLIMWVDRNRAEAVQSDWAKVHTFTKDKCDAWFKAKVKEVAADPNQYFSGGISPASNEYLVSNQKIGSGDTTTSYNNLERDYNSLVPETVSFNILTRDLIQWFGFVPEGFAHLDGDTLNVQMFTFKLGLAYSHYNGKTNTSYNVFYGVKSEKVMRLVYAEDAFAKKLPLVVTLYCEQQKFFADRIITEARQVSRILLEYWEKEAYFSYGTFLCDLNTPPDPNLPVETGANKLTDGDKLYGTWVDIRLIGDPNVNDKYCEILGITVLAAKYEKS